jgi:hypothetical protein
MPDRSRKRQKPSDVNQIAPIVDAAATGELPAEAGKNPAAVALGRLGGLKGGKARAKKLSASRRRAIAKQAAKSRWSKNR